MKETSRNGRDSLVTFLTTDNYYDDMYDNSSTPNHTHLAIKPHPLIIAWRASALFLPLAGVLNYNAIYHLSLSILTLGDYYDCVEFVILESFFEFVTLESFPTMLAIFTLTAML